MKTSLNWHGQFCYFICQFWKNCLIECYHNMNAKNEEFIYNNLMPCFALKSFSHFFSCEANMTTHRFKYPLLLLYRNFSTTRPFTISTSSYYSRLQSIQSTSKQIKFQTDVSNLSVQSLVHCNSFFSDLGIK